MVMRRLLSVTATGSFDLVWGKRTQLCFSRFKEGSYNDACNQDGESYDGFFHVVQSPYPFTIV
jgi:hypothetical protein